MTPTKSEKGFAISDIDITDAELLQTAVLQLAEQSNTEDHTRRLRRLAMEIDKILHSKNSYGEVLHS